MLVKSLYEKRLISPPKWLPNNTVLLTVTGSQAYGVSTDSSDVDIYGVCIPPKGLIFPHLDGEILGFGKQIKIFETYHEAHINYNEKQYDLSIYSIVKYFHLCMENNPNMLDSLFVPDNCVIHSSTVGNMIRDNRKIFLHKGSYHKHRGYAYAQISKIKNKVNSTNPKRAESIEKYGFDVKFAYHIVRLMLECEQILSTHDLDLQRDNEVLKSIRRGEWSLERIEEWFNNKEHTLDELYVKSTLQNVPDEASIKRLLMQCLEQHFGSISHAVNVNNDLLKDLQKLLEKYS